MISLFVVNFRKVLKHFLNLNTDERVSTALIKNGSILHFNLLYGFWSPSLLSQLDLIEVLVVGKVCFNLMERSLFVLCILSFFYCFLFLFGFPFLLFLLVSGQFSPKKIATPVRGRVWVSFRVRARIGRKFSSRGIVHRVTILKSFFHFIALLLEVCISSYWHKKLVLSVLAYACL